VGNKSLFHVARGAGSAYDSGGWSLREKLIPAEIRLLPFRPVQKFTTSGLGGYCCKSLFKPLMRFHPQRLIQNRSRISLLALKGGAAAEKFENRLWRDF
jgi:hypothetical protein